MRTDHSRFDSISGAKGRGFGPLRPHTSTKMCVFSTNKKVHLTRAYVFLKRFPRDVQFIKVKSKRLLFLDQSIARTCFTASDVSLK